MNSAAEQLDPFEPLLGNGRGGGPAIPALYLGDGPLVATVLDDVRRGRLDSAARELQEHRTDPASPGFQRFLAALSGPLAAVGRVRGTPLATVALDRAGVTPARSRHLVGEAGAVMHLWPDGAAHFDITYQDGIQLQDVRTVCGQTLPFAFRLQRGAWRRPPRLTDVTMSPCSVCAQQETVFGECAETRPLPLFADVADADVDRTAARTAQQRLTVLAAGPADELTARMLQQVADEAWVHAVVEHAVASANGQDSALVRSLGPANCERLRRRRVGRLRGRCMLIATVSDADWEALILDAFGSPQAPAERRTGLLLRRS